MATSNDAFFLLPAELRNRVYSELFFAEEGSVRVDRKFNNRLAILATSRLYHHEASTFFYGRNHFVLDASTNTTCTATKLPPIPDSYLPSVKRVTISMRSGHPRSVDVSRAAGMLIQLGKDTSVSLNDLTIIIAGAALSPFLNSRFDDSVMSIAHPITLALQIVLEAKVSKTIRVRLEDAWFAPGVISCLQHLFDNANNRSANNSLIFSSNSHISNPAPSDVTFERPLTNHYYDDPIYLFNSATSSETCPEGRRSSPESDVSFASLMGARLEESVSEEDDQDDLSDYQQEEELTSDDDIDFDEDFLPADDDSFSTMIYFAPEMF